MADASENLNDGGESSAEKSIPTSNTSNRVSTLPAPSSSTMNTTISPLEFVEQDLTTLGLSSLIANPSNLANSDGLSHNNLLVDEHDGMPHLSNTSLPACFEPAHETMAFILDPNTHYSSTLPNQNLLNHQQATKIIAAPTNGPVYQTTYPQYVPDGIFIEDSSLTDDSSTWSLPNMAYSNTYPSSTASTYANTTDLHKSYPNTIHPQLASYLYTSSNTKLTYPEWSYKKNNWEQERLENI